VSVIVRAMLASMRVIVGCVRFMQSIVDVVGAVLVFV